MRLSLLLSLISAFILTLSGVPAQAQNSCKSVHLEGFATSSNFVEASGLREWAEIQIRYTQSAKELPKAQARDQKIIYDAAFFFDLVHVREMFVTAIRTGKKLNVTELIRRYGDRKFFFTDKFEGPFANYVKTVDWLEGSKPEVTVETFKEINRRMLEGRTLVRLTESQKGQFREISVAGYLKNKGDVITAAHEKNYSENIYLNFIGHSIVFSTVLRKNPMQLERIRRQDPALASEVSKFQKENKDHNDPAYASLEQRAIQALVAERFSWFHKQKLEMGAITNKNAERYVEVVAKFQRDLVSIHPFWDGNGRTTRMLMNYLLVKENLPPSRIKDPNMDLNASLGQWQNAVKEGIRNTVDLTENFALRNELGLPVYRSEALINP